MTQNEVLEFLKEHPRKWFLTKEIADGLNVSKNSSSISTNLFRLRKFKLVLSEHVLVGAGSRRMWKYKYNFEVFK